MTWWELIDNMSSEPKLYLKGKSRYTTPFGGILTILAFISVIILAIYFFIMWFNGSQVNIVYASIKKGLTKSEMILKDRPIMWNLHSDAGMVDPSYFSITAYHISTKQDSSLTLLKLETASCDRVKSLQIPEITEQVFFGMKDYTCIRDTGGNLNLNITANNQDKSISMLTLSLAKCVNSTSSNTICKSNQEIDKYMEKYEIAYNLVVPSFTLDHFNVKSPISISIREETYKTNSLLYVNRMTFMKSMIYLDDQGNVLEDKKTTLMYDKDSQRSKEEYLKPKTDGSGTLLSHSLLILGEVEDNYRRSYPKLQNVIANIGGVVSLLFSIARILAGYISDQMLSLLMGNYMFDLSFGVDPPYQKEGYNTFIYGSGGSTGSNSGSHSGNNYVGNSGNNSGSNSNMVNPVNDPGGNSNPISNSGSCKNLTEKQGEGNINDVKEENEDKPYKYEYSFKTKVSSETYTPNKAKYGNVANSQSINFNTPIGNNLTKGHVKAYSCNKALKSSSGKLDRNNYSSPDGKNKYTENDNVTNSNNIDDLANSLKPLKPITNFKNKMNKKMQMRSLSFYDALCPKTFSRNNSNKNLIDPCEEAYRLKFSCDHIIKVISEFDNLKRVILDDEQRFIFKYVRLPSIFEFYENVKLGPKIEYDFDKLEGILNQMMVSEDKVTKSLLKLV
jgi:hypothetical protein